MPAAHPPPAGPGDDRDDLARRLVGAAGLFAAALVAGVSIGLLVVDAGLAAGLVRCDELDCLLPPLVGAAAGFVLGFGAGALLGVRLVRRRRWSTLWWAVGVAVVSAAALVWERRMG